MVISSTVFRAEHADAVELALVQHHRREPE